VVEEYNDPNVTFVAPDGCAGAAGEASAERALGAAGA
jgi:hypothetical protein